jgi:NADH-quinone oxidoreductase subunit E
MSRYPERRSASIPVLAAVQERYGWCTPEGMRQAAAVMRVTPAYLESLATFYDLFYTEPVGRHKVLVCTNICCWMRGGEELLEAFGEAAGCAGVAPGRPGQTSKDGELYVTPFECLGACELAPLASIDGRYFGPLAAEEANEAVQQLLAGDEVLPAKALARRGAAGGPEPEPDPRVAQAEEAPTDEQRGTNGAGS